MWQSLCALAKKFAAGSVTLTATVLPPCYHSAPNQPDAAEQCSGGFLRKPLLVCGSVWLLWLGTTFEPERREFESLRARH